MYYIKNYTNKIKIILFITGSLFFFQSFCSNTYSQNISAQNTSVQIRSVDSKYIDKVLFLRWRILSENNIYSFKLFRQDNLNGAYNNINAKAQVNTIKDSTYIIIVDSLVNYRSIYRYYAVLNDTTGHHKSVSDTMMAAAYNLNDVFQPLYTNAVGQDSIGAIKLSWKLNSPQDILTLKIFRSENYDSNYVELTEVANRDSIYMDRTAEPMKKYFYYQMEQ